MEKQKNVAWGTGSESCILHDFLHDSGFVGGGRFGGGGWGWRLLLCFVFCKLKNAAKYIAL